MEGYEAVFLLAKVTTALGVVVSLVAGYALVQDWIHRRGAFARRQPAEAPRTHARGTPWRPVYHRKAS
jgi:hypothetical protein